MSAAEIIVWIVIVVYAIFIVVGLIYILSPPANNPRSFLRQKEIACPGRKRIVIVGDSITHGHVGADYSALLRRRLNKAGKIVDVINAGINSRLAWNVLQNIDEIVACNPDYVTILIGTNDANSTLDPLNEKTYRKQWKLPRVPIDAAWYRKNLEEIIGTLKDLTKAKVAVLSLPTIGENPDDRGFKVGQSYSKIAKQVATEAGVAYLPLCEAMADRVKERPSLLQYDVKRQALMQYGQILLHYHGIPYSWISRAFKLRFHVDYLHLNNAGAAMVVDLIEKFVLGDEVSRAVVPKKVKRIGFWTRKIAETVQITSSTTLVPKQIDPDGLKIGFLMGMITMEGFKAICHLDESMTLAAFAKKIGWDEAKSAAMMRHLLDQDLIGIA
nr:GDSL-type esterase/lipase family protein [Candidatus Sigynarchaeum springense]